MRIEVHPTAVRDLRALPGELRRDAQNLLLDLLADPVPSAAEPYADIPGAYRVEGGLVVVFYLVVGEVIDIRRVRPNS